MNNLRILLYMMLLSLAACHPEGTSVKQGLDKAAQLMAQDPDTASIILETIQSSQMNEAQLAEYNLLCTQLNEDKSIPHSSDKQIRQAASYYEKHGDEYQKSKVYYYLACVESDLEQKRRLKFTSWKPLGSQKKQRNTIIWQKSANDVVFIIRNTVTLMKHWKWRERHTPVS